MSILWKFFTGKQEPWFIECVKHDWAYYNGGTYKQRLEADQKLYEAVKKTGHPIWALIIYIAVRFGGSTYWPLPWRWGFKYDWFEKYF
jgi:hypothetical protein